MLKTDTQFIASETRGEKKLGNLFTITKYIMLLKALLFGTYL